MLWPGIPGRARCAEGSNGSEPDQTATAEFQRTSKATFSIFARHTATGEDDFLQLSVRRDLDDCGTIVNGTLRCLPGVTSIRSDLSFKEMKASRKLPVRKR
ncbi:hypothetical protein NBRC116586_15780 [Pseudooceanicola nitratireducens]